MFFKSVNSYQPKTSNQYPVSSHQHLVYLFVSLLLVVSPLAAADIGFDLVDTGMEKEI